MDNAVAIDLLIRVMEHVNQESPQLAMELENLLQISLRKNSERLSRMQLMITHGGYDYRIILPDYDLEIEMPQRPKALFLFFLRHPKGIQLSDLPDHTAELLSIYSRIANLTATKTITDNIKRLTDLSDNSVHVNFARIKRAFLLKLTEKVAANYYITGKRGRAKRIHLPQHLLEIDPLLVSI